MRLLNFTQFINEAIKDEHADLRLDQRIIQTMVVSLPFDAREAIRDNGQSYSEVSAKLVDLLKSEGVRRFESRLVRFEFSMGHRVIVLMEPIFIVDGKRFPVKMTVSSWDPKNPKIVKSYAGEKLAGYVSDNAIDTIKVLPGSYSDQDIEDDAKNHLIRTGRERGRVIVNSSDSKFEVELTKDGEVKPWTLTTGSGLVNKIERDFVLSPGRPIMFFSQAKGEMVVVKIADVLNRDTYKTDKLFKVKILKSDGSEGLKTLKPGDSLSLPVGDDGGWLEARVSDRLYTTDNRVPNPILKVVA